MTPLAFSRHVTGVMRGVNRQTRQWRQTFALTYNVNRGEKDDPITGMDVWPLPGDKPVKPGKTIKQITPAEYARLTAIANQ